MSKLITVKDINIFSKKKKKEKGPKIKNIMTTAGVEPAIS